MSERGFVHLNQCLRGPEEGAETDRTGAAVGTSPRAVHALNCYMLLTAEP